MNQVTTQFITHVPRQSTRVPASLLAERVRDFACTFGVGGAGSEAGRDLWVRAAGRHIIVGRGENEAFARITPLGPEAYGLAFREPEAADANDASADAIGANADGGAGTDTSAASRSRCARWAPLLLIDALADVVEHALIGEGAMDQPPLCM